MKNVLSHWESGDAWRVVSLVALMFLCRTQPCVVKSIGRIYQIQVHDTIPATKNNIIISVN